MTEIELLNGYFFRGNHSTDVFLSFMTDKILKGFDKVCTLTRV